MLTHRQTTESTEDTETRVEFPVSSVIYFLIRRKTMPATTYSMPTKINPNLIVAQICAICGHGAALLPSSSVINARFSVASLMAASHKPQASNRPIICHALRCNTPAAITHAKAIVVEYTGMYK
jgi:hypothetical protein